MLKENALIHRQAVEWVINFPNREPTFATVKSIEIRRHLTSQSVIALYEQATHDTKPSGEAVMEEEPPRDPLRDVEDQRSCIGHAPIISESPREEAIKSDDLTRTPSHLDQGGVVARTLSRVRTKDSQKDPGPPPDGGMRAWTHVLLGHLVIFVTWGNINSFGVFQSYYTDHLNEAPSAISWIGGIQTFLTFIIGTFSGRALDAGFYKLTFCVGTFFQVLGFFMTSICQTYWQFFLAQGVCIGIGNGLVFVPTIALVSTYFLRRRSLALGLTASGSATGGLVFPSVVEKLLPEVGFGWTIRVLGFLVLMINIVAAIFIRPRLPPRKSGPIVEWSAFNEGPYLFFAIGAFLNFWGLYTGYYYVTSYAKDKLGVSYSESINLLLTMNGVGFPARVIPAWVADKYCGPLNIYIPSSICMAVILYCWTAVHSVAGIWLFAVFYGAVASVAQGLFPAVLSSLTKDPMKAGVRMGMCFSIVGCAVSTGPPISGALISRDNGNYLYTQIYVGTSIMIAACILLIARYTAVGWNWRAKI